MAATLFFFFFFERETEDDALFWAHGRRSGGTPPLFRFFPARLCETTAAEGGVERRTTWAYVFQGSWWSAKGKRLPRMRRRALFALFSYAFYGTGTKTVSDERNEKSTPLSQAPAFFFFRSPANVLVYARAAQKNDSAKSMHVAHLFFSLTSSMSKPPIFLFRRPSHLHFRMAVYLHRQEKKS